MTRLFVTGTDTEVGKTWVTACLARAAPGRVLAAKPIASGVQPGEVGSDAALLGRAAGHAPLTFAHFATPVSPHRAAHTEGRTIDGVALSAWVAALAADVVLVEGVGGWRVPLQLAPEALWVPDLARAAGGRVLVVAADRLGVINHTLLTVEAVRADGCAAVGVVLNRGVPGDAASRTTNVQDLKALLDIPVAVLPRVSLDDPAGMHHAGAALWRDLA